MAVSTTAPLLPQVLPTAVANALPLEPRPFPMVARYAALSACPHLTMAPLKLVGAIVYESAVAPP